MRQKHRMESNVRKKSKALHDKHTRKGVTKDKDRKNLLTPGVYAQVLSVGGCPMAH